MDYSRYYLKNYKELKDSIEGMNYNNVYYRYYRTEKQLSGEPAIEYYQPKTDVDEEERRADIEYDPSAAAPEERVVNRARGKSSFKRKAWLVALCFCLIALTCASTILATDILTDGAVIAGMKSAYTANKSGIYVSYLAGCADYESAKLQSEEMRKLGLGGYIAVKDGEYLVYADISSSENLLFGTYNGADLESTRLECDAPVLEEYPEKLRSLVEEYSDYTELFLGYMFDILQKLQSGEYDISAAAAECRRCEEEFELYIDGFLSSAEGYFGNVLKLVSDMRAESAFLAALARGTYASPQEMEADLRYYSLLAVFNRNASV